MDKPAVTVAIPTNGRWPLLARALRSALGQAESDIEVVVALDTPGFAVPPPEVIDMSDVRVRLTRAASRGLSHARNAAIHAARGEWIAFLDDDDLWAPTKLDQQLRAGKAEAGFVYGAAVVVGDNLEPLETHLAPAPNLLAKALLAYNAIPAGASNVMVRADVVRACDGFDPRFSHLADWDLWIRLAASAPAAAISEVVVAHVRHADSMLFQGGNVRREFTRMAHKHAAFAAEHGGRFDDNALLEWMVVRHLAAGHGARARLFRLRQLLRHGNRTAAGQRVFEAQRGAHLGWLAKEQRR